MFLLRWYRYPLAWYGSCHDQRITLAYIYKTYIVKRYKVRETSSPTSRCKRGLILQILSMEKPCKEWCRKYTVKSTTSEIKTGLITLQFNFTATVNKIMIILYRLNRWQLIYIWEEDGTLRRQKFLNARNHDHLSRFVSIRCFHVKTIICVFLTKSTCNSSSSFPSLLALTVCTMCYYQKCRFSF